MFAEGFTHFSLPSVTKQDPYNLFLHEQIVSNKGNEPTKISQNTQNKTDKMNILNEKKIVFFKNFVGKILVREI